MNVAVSDQMTHILDEIDEGKPQAASKLLPLVYEQLRQQAHRQMARERPGGTLDATALVHEAYLKLARDRPLKWAARTQFLHAAAGAMRRILIDRARSRRRIKRGGGRRRLCLTAVDLADSGDPAEILAVDEAIRHLEKQWPDVARVVRLRFYGGMSVEATAQALRVSQRTVYRDWTFARAWLIRELGYDKA